MESSSSPTNSPGRTPIQIAGVLLFWFPGGIRGRFGRPEACGNVDNTRGVAHNPTVAGSTSNKDSVKLFELEGGCSPVAQLEVAALL
jgi:hypothetical protein